jgi:hypothetical protein
MRQERAIIIGVNMMGPRKDRGYCNSQGETRKSEILFDRDAQVLLLPSQRDNYMAGKSARKRLLRSPFFGNLGDERLRVVASVLGTESNCCIREVWLPLLDTVVPLAATCA